MGTIFDNLTDDQQADAEEIFRGIESTWGLGDMSIEEAFKLGYAHAILNPKEAL